jgi:predicted DNA-binding protein with PD1-like motif
MEYSKVTTGRIFLARFDHGEDLLSGVEDIISRERISLATITLLGAIKKGEFVTGPREGKLPAIPNWSKVEDGWEVFGQGMIISDSGSTPKVHLHCSFGKNKEAYTGCLRKNAEVFVTVEAVITELTGVSIKRSHDELTGQNLMRM